MKKWMSIICLGFVVTGVILGRNGLQSQAAHQFFLMQRFFCMFYFFCFLISASSSKTTSFRTLM